jgi:ribosomal protein L29
MAIDESKRQDLYLMATEKFGRKEADTLMTLLPTSVWEDVATKTDLEFHSALLKIQFNEVHNDLRTEISGVRTELKGDIADLRAENASLRTELKGDIADVRLEIAELRTEMHQMFRKNYMVMISAIFTINSLFFAATKFWG